MEESQPRNASIIADSEIVSVDESRHRTSRLMWCLIGAGSMWFLLGFTLYFYNFHGALAQKSSEWNDFGVFIAGFSGTGVAVITLIAVANGIRVQAEDLAKSRSFMAKQSTTMAQQAFDSVFFNLLDRFSQVRDSVSVAIYMPKRVDGGSVPEMQTVFINRPTGIR